MAIEFRTEDAPPYGAIEQVAVGDGVVRHEGQVASALPVVGLGLLAGLDRPALALLVRPDGGLRVGTEAERRRTGRRLEGGCGG